jgi:hypothetical protein
MQTLNSMHQQFCQHVFHMKHEDYKSSLSLILLTRSDSKYFVKRLVLGSAVA